MAGTGVLVRQVGAEKVLLGPIVGRGVLVAVAPVTGM